MFRLITRQRATIKKRKKLPSNVALKLFWWKTASKKNPEKDLYRSSFLILEIGFIILNNVIPWLTFLRVGFELDRL